MADRYVAMEKFSKVAVSGDASAGYIEFTLPYTPVGYLAQVATVTTGVIKTSGLAVTVANGKIKVAVTGLAAGDVVSCIVF